MVIFFTLGGVYQNLSGQQTLSGPVFKQGHFKPYPDMLHYMVDRAENKEAVYMCFNEIGLWGGETTTNQNDRHRQKNTDCYL